MLHRHKWILSHIVLLIVSVKSQIGRSYDTSEWIPVTPLSNDDSAPVVEERKATGRVLNLASLPGEQISTEEGQIDRKFPQQYYREKVHSKPEIRRRPEKFKTDSPYKFESVPPPRQNIRPNQLPQNLELAPQYIQPPPPLQPQYLLSPVPQTNYQPPPVENVHYYPAQFALGNQYNPSLSISKDPSAKTELTGEVLPFNRSLYQSVNSGTLNQDIFSSSIRPETSLNIKATSTTPKNNIQKETVQLLYVPLENLKPSQEIGQQSQTILRQYDEPVRREKQSVSPPRQNQYSSVIDDRSPPSQNQFTSVIDDRLQLNSAPNLRPLNSYQLPQSNNNGDTNNQKLHQNIQDDFLKQALEAHKLQEQLENGQPLLLETTTAKPKKRKPHQPPLAVYMEADHNANIKEVLDVLKGAKEIEVQDSIREDSPQVFVGPSNLNPPDGYTKFPLPYLSNIDTNRIGRKVDQLPFFVAPLSYKTPPGYSKIPLPSPHVGSVVVSTKDEERERPASRPSYSKQNYLDNFSPKLESIPDISAYRVSEPQPKIPPQYQPNPYLNQYTTTPPLFTTKNQYQALLNSYLEPITTQSPEKLNDYIKQSIYQTTPAVKPQIQTEHYKIDEGSLEQLSAFTGTPKSVLRSQINQYINSQEQPRFSQEFTTPKPIQYTVVPEPKQTKQNVDFIPTDLNQYNYYKTEDKRTAKEEPTTSVPVQRQPQLVSHTNKPAILRQPINQYDLEQINNQFTTDAKKQAASFEYKDQNLPYRVEISTPKNVPERSTPKETDHSHRVNLEKTTSIPRRVRTRHRTTTTERPVTPTKSSIDSDRYTVLEEFSIRKGPSSTPSTFTSETDARRKLQPEYSSGIEQIPGNVYKIEPQQIQPQYVDRTVRPNSANSPNVEHIPANVYKIDPDQKQSPYSANSRVPDDSNRETPDQREIVSKPAQNTRISQSSFEQDSDESLPQNNQYNRFSLPTSQEQKYIESVLQNDNRGVFTYRQPQGNIQLQVSPDSISNIQQDQKITISNPTAYRTEDIDYNISPNLPQINPLLPDLINNLQDQGVRPLLRPTLLVPTTEQEIQSTSKYDQSPLNEHYEVTSHVPVVSITSTSTTPSPTTTEATIPTTTTSQKRQRGRQRGGSRFSTAPPTRRSSSRRRQQQTKSTTEYQSDYSSTTEYVPARIHKEQTEASRRSLVNRQRTRTRARPTTTDNSVSEHVSHAFRQPALESGFKASNGEPQSYMQFDHIIDNQEIVTVRSSEDYSEPPKAVKEYHQVYSLTPQERKEGIIENRPVVDVQISHPVTQKIREPSSDIITQPNADSQYVRFNGNVQSGGVLFNNRHNEDTTTARPFRVRGRGRAKIRTHPSTTTSTTTTAAPRIKLQKPAEEEEEEEEFYGFIRPPNFNRPANVPDRLQLQSGSERTPYIATYQSTQNPDRSYSANTDDYKTTHDYSDSESYSRPQIQFVGEIRPKYHTTIHSSSSISTTELPQSETEAPKVKTRTKIRVPARKQATSHQNADHEEHENRRYSQEPPSRATESSSRRNTIRSRGKSHYRLPENLKSKSSEDEDVEGGNYPATFFQHRETTTRPSAFQITVDPNYEDEESDEDSDQLPYSSINRPNVVTSPDGSWIEASLMSTANRIAIENKDANTAKTKLEQPLALPVQSNATLETDKDQEDQNNSTDKAEEEEIVETSTVNEASTEITTKKGKRRGVWKLIKQRPVDPFEMAESQNYHSILNSFDSIEKVPTKLTTEKPNDDEQLTEEMVTTTISPTSTSPESSFFDTLYDMFGISAEAQKEQEKPETTTMKELEVTTTAVPIFPNEYLEDTTSQSIDVNSTLNETTSSNSLGTASEKPTSSTTEASSTTSPKVEIVTGETLPWDSHLIKTSTSTEVSHETEICYKGKCVKSSLNKKIKS